MATPTNSVPLGQAGTGSAFVLNQQQAMAPFQTLTSLAANQAALQRAREKQQAEEDARNQARQQKLMEVPREFGFHFQEKGKDRVKNYMDNYVTMLTQDGGRVLSAQNERIAQRAKEDLYQFAESSKIAEKAAQDFHDNVIKDKEVNQEQAAKVFNEIFIDPSTGQIWDDPSMIKPENIESKLNGNYKLYNTGLVVDNFVNTLHKAHTEKFSSNGRFDIKTITENNLPIEVKGGQIQYDKQGRPKLRVTEGLLYQADQNPKIKNILDGLMREEDAKEAADPAYVGKIRPELLKELLQNEVYVETKMNRNRIPLGPAPRENKEATKQQAAIKRYQHIRSAFVDREPIAFKSLVNSNWSGGQILDVQEVDAPGQFQGGKGVKQYGDLYKQGQGKVIELTVDFGGEYQPIDPRNPILGSIRKPVIKKVRVDTSEPGWEAKVNAAMNTENANIEPEVFKEVLEREKPASRRNAAGSLNAGNLRGQSSSSTPKVGSFNLKNLKGK